MEILYFKNINMVTKRNLVVIVGEFNWQDATVGNMFKR